MADTRKLKALGYKVFEDETEGKYKIVLAIKGKDARFIIEHANEQKMFIWKPTVEVIYDIDYMYAVRDVDNGYLIRLCKKNGGVKKEIKYHPRAGVLDITGVLQHLGELLVYSPDTTEDTWIHDYKNNKTYSLPNATIKRCGYEKYDFLTRLYDGKLEIGDGDTWCRVKSYELGNLLKDAIVNEEVK